MSKRDYKGDLIGGITGTVLMLPASLALGPLIFAALGPEHIPMGVVAGLISLCFTNVGSALIRGNPVIINGPSAVSSVMLAAALGAIARETGAEPHGVIQLFFLLVFLSGLMQAGFGLLKMGHLAQYIPYPVMSGLLNGTAFTIVLSQAHNIIDLGGLGSGLFSSAAEALPLVLAAVTVCGIIVGKKFLRSIPPPLTGMFAGVSAYLLVRVSGIPSESVRVIGRLQGGIPRPMNLAGLSYSSELDPVQILMMLIPLALSIAVVNSLRTLITAVSVDSIAGERTDTNRELCGQGAGNMLSAVFGGISGAGLGSGSTTNYLYGGRSRWSKLAAAAGALSILLFFSPLISLLPKIILAAVILMFGLTAFDRWSLELVTRLRCGKCKTGHVWVDLLIMAAVAAILVGFGIFQAVAAGILISLVVFTVKMGKDIVRRDLTGADIQSSIHRSRDELNFLSKCGERIRILELDGALFFGTADKLAVYIDRIISQNAPDYLILDLKRVSEIDSTGANILSQIRERCEKRGISLALSSLDKRSRLGSFLESLGIYEIFGKNIVFEKTDYALAWAEDSLIRARVSPPIMDRELALTDLGIFSDFDKLELRLISKHLIMKEFKPGETVFRWDDEPDGMYFILKGRMHVITGSGVSGHRVGTLVAGAVFGEMSTIDGKPRSATVVAEGQAKCLFLAVDSMANIEKKRPGLAYKLILGITRELSMRFRIANRIAMNLHP